MSRDRSHRIAAWVAMVTCAVVVWPVVRQLLAEPTALLRPRVATWAATLVLFVVAFWSHKEEGPRLRSLAWLAVLSGSAVAMGWLIPYSTQAILLVLVAATLGFTDPEHFSPRASRADEELSPFGVARWTLPWITLQTLAFSWPLVEDEGLESTAFTAIAFLAFQLFALYAAATAERERRGRVALARVNAELRSTRRLLEDSSRAAERLKISRDLHDILGHHLTALSLNLETARHAPAERAAESVETAQGIARRLLSEVRQVVGRLREAGEVDLIGALRSLVEDLEGSLERPKIHLTLPESLPDLEVRQAEALLRSAQELVTNTLRHAGADHLWIELDEALGDTPSTDDLPGFRLTARDDGRGLGKTGAEGAAKVYGGSTHGLRGLVERVEALGGTVTFRHPETGGFEARVWIPRELPGERDGEEGASDD